MRKIKVNHNCFDRYTDHFSVSHNISNLSFQTGWVFFIILLIFVVTSLLVN